MNLRKRIFFKRCVEDVKCAMKGHGHVLSRQRMIQLFKYLYLVHGNINKVFDEGSVEDKTNDEINTGMRTILLALVLYNRIESSPRPKKSLNYFAMCIALSLKFNEDTDVYGIEKMLKVKSFARNERCALRALGYNIYISPEEYFFKLHSFKLP